MKDIKWNISYPECNEKKHYELESIFTDSIPYLWFIYETLFEYIGYKSLHIVVAKAHLKLLQPKKKVFKS